MAGASELDVACPWRRSGIIRKPFSRAVGQPHNRLVFSYLQAALSLNSLHYPTQFIPAHPKCKSPLLFVTDMIPLIESWVQILAALPLYTVRRLCVSISRIR